MNLFGSFIRERRESKGFTLRQLEALTGVSNGYLSQIESGRVGAPSIKIIERLATALDTPYADLVGAAGYRSTERLDGEYVRLNGQTLPLNDLTAEDRASLLRFIHFLKSGSTGVTGD